MVGLERAAWPQRMTQDPPAADALAVVPLALLEATRSLLQLDTAADARRVATVLIRGLGGAVVAGGGTDGVDTVPADVSFGEGGPLLAAAAPGSVARALLDRYLTPFLLDAQRALELSGRVERLAETASIDVLTGLPNRRTLDHALGRLTLDDTVIIVDLDHFKRINDEHGHAAGDNVLRVFGRVLRGIRRARDFIGRFGGEEFVVILAGSTGADPFLQRLRGEWLNHRPFPVTFSAGIARSAGSADQTMGMADEALYRSKNAGRDRWSWATTPQSQGRDQSRVRVQTYLDDAVLGNRRPAVRLALDLLDMRVPREEIVVDLLAVAQREVGERWYRNELTAADEHLASGVAAAALDALASEDGAAAGEGHTVVTCAEGDWHSLAAHMLGETLRARGQGVTVLGASTPAEVVSEFLARTGGDSLAISCSLPIFFPGAVALVDAAHRQGIPVIVGGRAFGRDARRAVHLGADAWAATAGEAATILAGWRAEPLAINREPTHLHPVARDLFARANALGAAAFDGLVTRFAPMATYDARQLARTREDLGYTVQFLAAAIAASDESIFTEFTQWLQTLLVHRGVPPQALISGLDALHPVIDAIDAPAAQLLRLGRQDLLDRLSH